MDGPGKIIEIDEAKIGKRKYNKGRIIQGQWVFRSIERNTKKSFHFARIKSKYRNTLAYH